MSRPPTRQFTFRLQDELVERVDECVKRVQSSGLSVTRTDVVRLLLNHALATVHCDVKELLASIPPSGD